MKFLLAVSLIATLPCAAQDGSVSIPDSNAEALAVCAVLESPPKRFTPYEFARATLVSLWYARNAAERSREMNQAANGASNSFSAVTAMMRITKTSTNDFMCAKRSIKPFAVKQAGENISTASDFLAVVYDSHISINARMLDLLKKLDTMPQAELMDQISTLQVERSQRWADLVEPTTLAVISLVDGSRANESGKATWLVIAKAQKKALLDWANEHFPEYSNGTPKDQWSDPAKTAQLYFTFLNGRKCADE
jgi:hypothetical protein